MRIAILSTAHPLPPFNYGGTELIVHGLVNALAEKGHDVTLFGHPNSKVHPSVKIVPIFISFERDNYTIYLDTEQSQCGKFDVIHDHSNDGKICPERWLNRPYLSTVHGEGNFGQKNRVYISFRQRMLQADNNSPIVYHGLDGSKLLFRDKKSNYLLWIGRLDPLKDPKMAIDLAKKVNMPLILAGPICDHGYFDNQIKPELCEKIKWIGPVGNPHKDQIFADAKATIFTCNWREPFGLTIIESMFAGTPVIAFDNGRNAINEILVHKTSGFICTTFEQMCDHVQQLDILEPRFVRKEADDRFSQNRMVIDYLHLYSRVAKGECWI